MKNTFSDTPLIQYPSAWMPMAVSLAALAFLAVYVAVFGISHPAGADEGAPARIFQLLLLIALAGSGWFAARWLPKRPRPALAILALQAAAWILPILLVLWLESR